MTFFTEFDEAYKAAQNIWITLPFWVTSIIMMRFLAAEYMFSGCYSLTDPNYKSTLIYQKMKHLRIFSGICFLVGLVVIPVFEIFCLGLRPSVVAAALLHMMDFSLLIVPYGIFLIVFLMRKDKWVE